MNRREVVTDNRRDNSNETDMGLMNVNRKICKKIQVILSIGYKE